ncbi:MAG: metallophosphoesterase, partial [Paraclostridium sp.]
MKITIASDIHLNLILAKKIVSTKSDMIIISGDLSNRGHMEEIELILNIINKSEAKYKIVVFGNH